MDAKERDVVLPSKITGLLVVTYNYSCKIEVFSITLSALDELRQNALLTVQLNHGFLSSGLARYF